FMRAGLLSLLVVALLAAGTGVYTFVRVNGNINDGINEELDKYLLENAPDGPLNILVVGSDRRDVIEGEDRDKRQFRGGGGQRTDTIILVHIAASKEKAVLVSIPRDLRVRIPGHGHNKVNAAYTFGGAKLLIETVTDLTGIQPTNYVEVNFASFRSIVDAVGGVSIYVNRKMVDKKAGLNLPRAGCYKMDGDTALSFVRARNVDPTADLGRIQRQQLFMRSLLRRMKSADVILNPKRALDVSAAIGKGFEYDSKVDLKLARAIANKLAGYDQKRLDFRIVPGYGDTVGGVSYVLPKRSQMNALFAAIKADAEELPPFGKTKQSIPDPEDVVVKVLNGTGKAGVARTEADRLRKAGFKIQATENGPEQARTVITFNPDAELKAQLLKKLYPKAVTKVATRNQVADVVVLIGSHHLRATPAPSGTASPKADPTPTLDDKPLLSERCK
ncbi:MAG TPA: LCP family protein, partial [Actinomycetota bacterium]|nr:LCP family protein [Actinomycetota bacterium]